MAETIYGFGCLLDKTDIRDYKIAAAAVKAITYPETFECAKIARVKNQGGVGSCTAHATSTILEHHYTGIDAQLSTNFIYGIHNKLFGSEGPGLSLREALKTVLQYGDPEYDYCKGNTEVSKVYGIAEQAFEDPVAMENAAKYKISGYARANNINDVKYALMNYGPVLACISWYNGNTCDENGVLTMGDSLNCYHAIVVYGWNEIGWLCQNSWGIRWGKKGYFIVPYEYGLEEAFSIIPTGISMDKDVIKKPIRNKFLDLIYKLLNSILNKIRDALEE